MKQNLHLKWFSVFSLLMTLGLYTFAQSTLIISEVADPKDDYHGRFVQLFNSDSASIDLEAGNYYLVKQVNGKPTSVDSIKLTGTIPANGIFVIAGYSDFATLYSFDANITNSSVNGNGDDGYFLYKGGGNVSGTLVDAYGVLDEDGTGKPWEYTDGKAVRNSNIGTPNTTWTASEWTITRPSNVADMNPGTHTYSAGGDTEPPSWSTGFPKASFIEDTRAVLYVKMNESGNAYYIVVPTGSTTPTSDEVKAGNNYGSVSITGHGTISVSSPEVSFSDVLTGLSPSTAYDIWVVSDDASGNLQSSPTVVAVTTTASRSLSFVKPVAGDSYSIKDTMLLKWNSANIDSLWVGAYNFKKNQLFFIIDKPIAADKGTYKLPVPVEADTGKYTLYLFDSYDTSFKASVTPVFIVDNRELTLTKPQAGDTVYAGDSISFSWTSSKVDSVLIGGYNYTDNSWFMITGDLDHNTKEYWKPISASLGKYKFYIPKEVGGDQKLAIYLYDASDTSFHDIVQPVFISDTFPLGIRATAPTFDMVDFPETGAITCQFSSNNIIPGKGMVHIYNSDGSLYEEYDSTKITFSSGGFYFIPNPQLIKGHSYYIQIDSGFVKDVSGKVFSGLNDKSWSFKVATNDLFFSEYIEGSGNNKALELYNNTDRDINLDNYKILGSYNGNISSDMFSFPKGVILKPGDVYVIANIDADAAITSVANAKYKYNEGAYVVGFNGDDARVLIRVINNISFAWVDQIGQPDMDPGSGWDVAGVTNATKDHTLWRKAITKIGTTDWPSSAGTDTDNSQWIVKDKNDFSNIGKPTPSLTGINNSNLAKQISLYPNPGNGIFTIGLNQLFNGNVMIKIMDVTGKVIYKKDYSNVPNHISVNISNYPANLYFIQLQDSKSTIIKRFMKK